MKPRVDRNRVVGWASLCAISLFFTLLAQAQATTAEEQWPTVAADLVKRLSDGNQEEKREALFQIRNLRTPDASRIALPALRDNSEIVRATAAGSVIFLPPAEAATALIPLVSDKSEMVRREAAYALGEAGDPSAAAPLIKLLQHDKIIEVKGAAAVALGMIGDVSAVEALTSVLRVGPDEDREFLRRAAARSIGQIAQFIQTGRKGRVLTPQNFLPEKFKEIDKARYPDLAAQFPAFAPAIRALTRSLQNKAESDDTKREAAFALGAIGDASALPVLETGLNSPDPYLVEICKEAIVRIRQT